MSVPPVFRHTGIVMLRASTDPGDLDVPCGMDLADDAAVRAEGLAWLAKTWARDDVRDSITLASSTLAASVDRLLARSAATVKDLRRAVTSVAGYLLRWQGRATPFGVFAGVALASVGPTEVTIGRRHRTIARADSEWLAAIIDRLERHPQLRRQLMVVADNTSVIRDGRVHTARRADIDAGTAVPLREASVRYTAPVAAALTLATAPIQVDALAAQLAARFPAASAEQIAGVVDTLVANGSLITSLRAPVTDVDALRHVIDAATAAGGRQLADVAPLLGELDTVRDILDDHNTLTEPAQAYTVRASAARHMRRIFAGRTPVLAVDTRLDATARIPEHVLTEAVRAADVLLRLSTKPFGSTAWQDYRSRFRATYGQGALVPVRELVADSGLGLPTGYLGAPRAHPSWRAITERDAVFLALVQRAALDELDEIALTDDDVTALTVGDPADVIAPPRIEIGVSVYAASSAALDRRDFQLQLAASPPLPTSMAGRFAYLFDDADRARLVAACTAPMQDSAAVAVQLSFPPRRPHNENVTRTGRLLPDIVALAEHPTGDPMGLDDLAVTADADQMYLVQISTGRRVIPHIPHALDTMVQSPPLARFLAEVADARTAIVGPLDVGAARTLPYLPRVRYGRTVLSAARWLLSAADLPGPASSGWDEALAVWRQRWRAPQHVVLCHGELRQPLDLTRRLDRALLRSRLAKTDRVELREDAMPTDQGWIGRPAELLIPMVPVAPAPRPLPPITPAGRRYLPGDSDVVHARLAGNPARFDAVIAHLPALVASLGPAVSRWWIRRRRDLVRLDADQHFTVTLRLSSPEHFATAAAGLAAFADTMARRGLPGGLTLVPYHDQLGRYGHDAALTAAEEVFAADTACVIAQIAAADTSGIPAQALAAVSMLWIAAGFAADPPAGYATLVRLLPQQTGPLDRALHEHTLQLADSTIGPAETRSSPRPAGTDKVLDTWRDRSVVLRRYFDAVAAQRDPATVLPTLLRDHHIRALGIDPGFEQTTDRLVRAAALRCLARSVLR
ncbi:lantibiotic dehydratase [Hamadaea tsunoensis]|uniref:lantibiotic dehydratase n=1 Tax=Hamadaea tsunoensis TaxID=53368 RepID=UPI00041C075A|nr:lantibiotic dehydratase [Hamadaea tsunoensis]